MSNEHLLIALQQQRDMHRDRADRAEDRIREAIRWCELVSGSKSPGARTAKMVSGILRDEPNDARDDRPPEPWIRFDTSEADPDLIDVVFLLDDQEVHRVRDLTEAEILESFGVAREKFATLSLSS